MSGGAILGKNTIVCFWSFEFDSLPQWRCLGGTGPKSLELGGTWAGGAHGGAIRVEMVSKARDCMRALWSEGSEQEDSKDRAPRLPKGSGR